MEKFPSYVSSSSTGGLDSSVYRIKGTATLERWYSSAHTNFVSTTLSGLGASVLRSTPFIVSETITLDRIAMEITAAGTAGSVLRMGIYSSTNSLPTTLVLDSAVDKTSGTGLLLADSATFQSVEINKTLTAGLYWLCYVHNSAATLTCRAITSTAIPHILGAPTALGTGTYASFLSSTLTYGALPSAFDNTGLAAVVGNPAIISVRLSA